ncbi:hypothetical protein MHYP_G00236800 [Metynnis hypsauchen]
MLEQFCGKLSGAADGKHKHSHALELTHSVPITHLYVIRSARRFDTSRAAPSAVVLQATSDSLLTYA